MKPLYYNDLLTSFDQNTLFSIDAKLEYSPIDTFALITPIGLGSIEIEQAPKTGEAPILEAPGDLVWSESFETDGEGVRYVVKESAVSTAPGGTLVVAASGADASNDAFARVNVGTQSGNDMFAVTGTHWWAVEDTDSIPTVSGGEDFMVLEFAAIDTTGLSNLTFSVDVGNPESFGSWDSDSYAYFEYSTDGGATFTRMLQWTGNLGTGLSNTGFGVLDADLNGIGDGAALNSNFTSYSADFAITTNSLIIRFASENLASSEEAFAFDNLRLLEAASPNQTLDGDGDSNTLTAGAGDDTLNGLGGVDFLYGLAGNDTLNGGDDNDFLVGGEGADVNNGGSGNDVVSYITATAGVTVDLLNGANNTGDAAGDTYISIERILGSDFNDVFVGDNSGGFFRGKEGDDTFTGGTGNDLFIGDGGADTFNGGGGRDTVSYAVATAGVTVNMLTPASGGGEALGDVFNSIEEILGSQFGDNISGTNVQDRLRGGDGVDTISGLDGNDLIFGDGGNDILIGGEGNDNLTGGAGADNHIGGNGNDAASYQSSTSGVRIDLIDGSNGAGDGLGDTFTSIERFVGSNFDDTFNGSEQGDFFRGRDGNDTFNGLGGNDTFIGDGGADTFRGGEGVDTVSYRLSTAGVQVDTGVPANAMGDAVGDTYDSIERIEGSNVADAMYGNDLRDKFFGLDGTDVLDGRGGDDILEGGAGNDFLFGRAGLDRLFGGADDDTMTGGADNDIFRFVTNEGNDTITDFDQDGDDVMVFSASSGVTSMADLAIAQNGDDVLITYAQGTITLSDTLLADVGADDFGFVM